MVTVPERRNLEMEIEAGLAYLRQTEMELKTRQGCKASLVAEALVSIQEKVDNLDKGIMGLQVAVAETRERLLQLALDRHAADGAKTTETATGMLQLRESEKLVVDDEDVLKDAITLYNMRSTLIRETLFLPRVRNWVSVITKMDKRVDGAHLEPEFSIAVKFAGEKERTGS